jgi:hypothetical protein
LEERFPDLVETRPESIRFIDGIEAVGQQPLAA